MFVYAIKSIEHNYLYIGLSAVFDLRFKRNNSGWERTTKKYRPFRPIFLISVAERQTARLFEKYFKSGVGREFLRSLI